MTCIYMYMYVCMGPMISFLRPKGAVFLLAV